MVQGPKRPAFLTVGRRRGSVSYTHLRAHAALRPPHAHSPMPRGLSAPRDSSRSQPPRPTTCNRALPAFLTVHERLTARKKFPQHIEQRRGRRFDIHGVKKARTSSADPVRCNQFSLPSSSSDCQESRALRTLHHAAAASLPVRLMTRREGLQFLKPIPIMPPTSEPRGTGLRALEVWHVWTTRSIPW